MRILPGAFLSALLLATSAVAEPPPPMTSSVYEFPGAVTSPGSAASAGVGMADAWLGDEPFENPAIPAWRGVSLSPLLYHVSRQDLRGLNRSFSEQSAFFDGAGGWLAFRAGGAALFVYGHQPILRLEENAYLTGPLSGAPAAVENTSHAREARAGAGASMGASALRFGAAVELTYRDDSYATVDRSGSPLSGSSEASFSGSAVGGQAGARAELFGDGVGHLTLGAGVRFVPELAVEGDRVANLAASGTFEGPFEATRESGFEAGLSARWTATSQIRVVGGAGGRTAQEWEGFDVTRGKGFRWGLGLDFHDERDPWTLRFGLGQSNETGVPEPQRGIVAVGFGWKMEGTTIDIGAMRHSFSHREGATSYDDRVVLTAIVPF